MEAEHAAAVSGWSEVSGLSGTAMRDDAASGQGTMHYSITFTQTGNYYVYLLAQRDPSCLSGECNDAALTLDGERLYGSDDQTRPEGMRTNCGGFCWTYLPKGPGGNTPAAINYDPVHFKVSATGTKTLEIRSRSAKYVIDKIVMILDGGAGAKPSGTGPPETL